MCPLEKATEQYLPSWINGGLELILLCKESFEQLRAIQIQRKIEMLNLAIFNALKSNECCQESELCTQVRQTCSHLP